MSVPDTAAGVERGGGPFAGLDVAEVAGLRLAPGSARPVFDQGVWNLSGLADAPVIMGAHRKTLDFTQIANPRWRLVARQYLLARMAPGHPAVATLPHAVRSPLNPNSLWTALKHLSNTRSSPPLPPRHTAAASHVRHSSHFVNRLSVRRWCLRCG